MKKAIFQIYHLVIFAVIAMVIIMFALVMLQETYNTYIMNPLWDTINSSGLDYTGQAGTTMEKVHNYATGFDYFFDMIFILLFVFVFITSIQAAFIMRAISKMFFLLYLFGSTILLGLIIFYVQDFVTWFVNNYFFAVFDISLPMFSYVMNNLGYILFMWALILLIVNQIKNFVDLEGLLSR